MNNFLKDMKKFLKDMKNIFRVFYEDIKNVDTLIKKLLSYIIVVVLLKYLGLFNILQQIKISHWFIIFLIYMASFFLMFVSLKNKWIPLISGTFKEFSQIIYTGLGLIFIGTIFSIYSNYSHDKIIFLGLIIIISLIVKFYLALFKYFEEREPKSEKPSKY